MRKHVLALIAVMVSVLVPAAAPAQQSPESQTTSTRDSMADIAASFKGSPALTVIEDPLTGCRYFATVEKTSPMYSALALATIRYRRDGKPDCRDVR
jgi:hypothetical protein